MATTDLDVSNLSGESLRLAKAITKFIEKDLGETPDGGGCKAFYSPKEWADRGEEYGTGSKLIIVHDGGDLAPYCNYDYDCYPRVEKLTNMLKEKGYYIEQCTTWYSAVYKA